MHTDKRKPAGDWNPATGHTDDAIVPANAGDALKSVEALRTELALRGHTLRIMAFGYSVERWGLRRELATVDDVRAFLAQIGGAA